MKQSCCLQLEALRLCNLRNAAGMSMNGDPERVCVCVCARLGMATVHEQGVQAARSVLRQRRH